MSESAAVRAALRVLLDRVVDYAGLFPPAQLPMANAVKNYAEYRASGDAWMLGRFVVPASRLEEFDEEGAPYFPQVASQSWAVSVLLGADVELDVRSIERFNDRHRDVKLGAVHADTVEYRASRAEEIQAAEPFVGAYDAFVEIPVAEDPTPLVRAIAKTTAKAKIRTGGTSADAFPGPRHVVRFMRCCLDRGVAFKATAGLHHPLRAEYALTYAPDAPTGLMYGFMNMFLASVFLAKGMEEGEVLALLDERDPSAIEVRSDGVRWRGCLATVDELRLGRQEAMAFGSCSFQEPVAELRAMGLL